MNEPALLFREHLPDLREACARGPLLDLACGRGRHARAAAEAGLPTWALDRNAGFLAEIAASAPAVACVRFDLEAGFRPPLRTEKFGAVVVFRYLHRALAPALEALLAPGALLLYETFTTEQLALGTGPKSPDFLLAPGELRTLFPSLEEISYAEGEQEGAMTARLVARKA